MKKEDQKGGKPGTGGTSNTGVGPGGRGRNLDKAINKLDKAINRKPSARGKPGGGRKDEILPEAAPDYCDAELPGDGDTPTY